MCYLGGFSCGQDQIPKGPCSGSSKLSRGRIVMTLSLVHRSSQGNTRRQEGLEKYKEDLSNTTLICCSLVVIPD
jgi:hypothetical protein